MKIFKFESSIINWINKYKDELFLAFITCFALIARFTLFNYESGDYIYCLKNWFGHYLHYGIGGLRFTIGDYNCIYNIILAILTYIPISSLYSIKVVSIIFDFVCAIYAYKLVYLILKNKKLAYVAYGAVLFLPTVLLNSAAWAQCDSIYAAFAIMSIYYLIKEKYVWAFILAGLSFAFKLQFVFILPLFVIYYFVTKKFSIFNFLIIPLVNAVCALPSIILGRNAIAALFAYYFQAGKFSALVMKLPNMYNLLPADSMFGHFGIVMTFIIIVALVYYCLRYVPKLDANKILILSVYLVVIITYFLPHMHERYLFIADILSVVWFISLTNKNFKYFIIPLVINFVSLYGYIVCLFEMPLYGFTVLSMLYIPFVIYITYITLKELKS